MSGLNQVTLIGRLGKDPEGRALNNGSRVVNLRIATSETWRDKQTGERQEKTEWHTVVIYNEGIGKVAEQYLRKGSQCFIQGKLQTRKWQDQSGVDKYTTEIVLGPFNAVLQLLDPKPRDGGSVASEAGEDSSARPRAGAGAPRGSLAEELDDEIPFISGGGIW